MVDKSDLREVILHKSQEMFLEHGIKRVVIDDICDALKISKKTFYSIFKTKSDLIECVLVEIRKQKRAQMYIPEDKNIIDSIIDTHIFKQQVKNADMCSQIYYDLIKYYPKIYEDHVYKIHKSAKKAISDMINRGIQQGFFREDIDSELMKVMINNMFYGMFVYSQKTKISTHKIMNFCVDSMLRLLCNKKGMEYYIPKTKFNK